MKLLCLFESDLACCEGGIDPIVDQPVVSFKSYYYLSLIFCSDKFCCYNKKFVLKYYGLYSVVGEFET